MPSCPALCRASTSLSRLHEDVDGRAEPGHDELVEEMFMATHNLLLLPGDGIGPEVMAEVKRLIDWLNAKGIPHFNTQQRPLGGAAYDAHHVSTAQHNSA